MTSSSFLAMIRELSRLPEAEFHFRIQVYANSRHAFEFIQRALIASYGSDTCIPADDWPTEKHWSKEVWLRKEA